MAATGHVPRLIWNTGPARPGAVSIASVRLRVGKPRPGAGTAAPTKTVAAADIDTSLD